MIERTKSTMRPRIATLGSALLLGTALFCLPVGASFAQTAPAAAPSAPAAAPKPTDTVATVGDEKITEGDLGYAAEDLGQQLQNVPADQQKAFLTTVLIDMKIMAQAARQQNLQDTPDYKARLAYLEDRALRRAYFDDTITKLVTPEAIKAAYDDYAKSFQPQDQVRARHILVKTQAEAQDIKKQLDGGAKFEDLAKAKSIDTGSAANGGELGFFAKGQMVKPFEDAAFGLKVGQVSDPIQTQFGWHIIQVEELGKTKPTPFEQVAPQLQQQVLFKTFDDTVAKLKAGVKVDIPDPTLAAAVKAQEQQAAQPQPPAPAGQ